MNYYLLLDCSFNLTIISKTVTLVLLIDDQFKLKKEGEVKLSGKLNRKQRRKFEKIKK
jgi:hypothetical protein